jgi:hypothetical protein
MYNVNNYKNNVLNEQAAVISDDLKVRMKQYLDNEDFLEILSAKFADLEDGEVTTSQELQIDTAEYGFIGDDILHIRVDKSDLKAPRFEMWLMNEAFIFGDVDMDLTAQILHQSTKGDLGIVGTGLNYLGSLVGLGDPGDDGTDEEKLIGVAAALGSIARDKHIDPKVYFDKLAEVYKKKFGVSLVSILETEFSGRAEAAALNTFRRDISANVARGVSLPSILGDIVLTIATFGIGTAAAASVRGTSVAARLASKGTKIAKATKVGRGAIKGVKGVKGVISRIPGFSRLAPGIQATHLGKVIKVGQTVKHTYKGKMVAHKVVAIGGKVNGVQLARIADKAKKIPAGTFATSGGDFLMNVTPGLANKVLTLAKINPTKAGLALAAKKAGEVGDGVGGTSAAGATGFGKAMEVMGYYDTLTADPGEYIADIKDTDSASLASMIYDLKEGTGFWGNTTNQEELAMALIVTSLSAEGATRTKDEYEKLDGGSVSAVLADELGGDMGMFAKYWWNAIAGADLDANTAAIKARINQKQK